MQCIITRNIDKVLIEPSLFGEIRIHLGDYCFQVTKDEAVEIITWIDRILSGDPSQYK